MMERERLRHRAREPEPESRYEIIYNYMNDRRELGYSGRVVVTAAETPYEQNRQGYLRYYLYPGAQDVSLPDWMVFTHQISTKSGKHRHQGGLVIYVVEGEGYTTVDEERVDWEAGDLLLLPIQPNGVSHQHFNTWSQGPSTWLALVFTPWFDALGDELVQQEVAAAYTGRAR